MKLTKKLRNTIDREIKRFGKLNDEDSIDWRDIVIALTKNYSIELFGGDDDEEVLDYLTFKVKEYNEGE